MISKANSEDSRSVAQLAAKMWNETTVEDLTEEYKLLIANAEAAVFLLKKDNRCVGFAQCQLRRDYVEGTDSSPVGYLEGVYVEEQYRRNGFARMLVQACEQWAREQGCSEFGSDCELANSHSLAFHVHCGFQEVNRIICFTKTL